MSVLWRLREAAFPPQDKLLSPEPLALRPFALHIRTRVQIPEGWGLVGQLVLHPWWQESGRVKGIPLVRPEVWRLRPARDLHRKRNTHLLEAIVGVSKLEDLVVLRLQGEPRRLPAHGLQRQLVAFRNARAVVAIAFEGEAA